jgi:hypothetical protein
MMIMTDKMIRAWRRRWLWPTLMNNPEFEETDRYHENPDSP